MRYQTSFNMHVTTMAKLANATKRIGLSITKLIVQLMYHYAKEYRSTNFARGTVKYQKSHPWKMKIHN